MRPLPLVEAAPGLVKKFCGPLTCGVILVRVVRCDSNVYGIEVLVAGYPFSHLTAAPVKICLVKHLSVFEVAHSRVRAQSIKNRKQKACAAADRFVGADQCGMKKGGEWNSPRDEI